MPHALLMVGRSASWFIVCIAATCFHFKRENILDAIATRRFRKTPIRKATTYIVRNGRVCYNSCACVRVNHYVRYFLMTIVNFAPIAIPQIMLLNTILCDFEQPLGVRKNIVQLWCGGSALCCNAERPRLNFMKI